MSEQDKGGLQSEGRDQNSAQPLDAAEGGGPERYPSVRQDDAVERTGRTEAVTGESRTFEGPANPEPPQGAGDTSTPPSANDGRLGPGADPAEGKR